MLAADRAARDAGMPGADPLLNKGIEGYDTSSIEDMRKALAISYIKDARKGLEGVISNNSGTIGEARARLNAAKTLTSATADQNLKNLDKETKEKLRLLEEEEARYNSSNEAALKYQRGLQSVYDEEKKVAGARVAAAREAYQLQLQTIANNQQASEEDRKKQIQDLGNKAETLRQAYEVESKIGRAHV